MDAINPKHYKRLPAEAIEIIEAAIDNAPSVQVAYLHGQALKYLLRCWNKNGIEDLQKAKWYLDRLIDSFDESEQQPVIKQSLTTEPPDGYRWLEVGEVIRKGDLPYKDGLVYATEPIMLGMALQEHWKPMIRRNKFEVGERVVWVADDTVWTVHQQKSEITSCQSYIVRSGNLGWLLTTASKLAPYIEEQS